MDIVSQITNYCDCQVLFQAHLNICSFLNLGVNTNITIYHERNTEAVIGNPF